MANTLEFDSSNLGSTPGGAVFQFKKSEGLGVWILMLY